MNIFDPQQLLKPEWEMLIKDIAQKPFKLEGFSNLEDIHKKEEIDVVIENIATKKPTLHQEAESSLRNELERKITVERKNEIYRLLKSLSKVIVLGEYKPRKRNIYLYINTIAAKGKDLEQYVLTTYLHEMMHAYFDRTGHEHYPFIYEIEESLAEAGMLLFLDKTQNSNLKWAIQNVKNKFPELKEYAFGAHLYEQWKMNQTDLAIRVEEYKVSNSHFSQNSIFQRIKSKRDNFEEWLLSNRVKPLSAVYNACYIPLSPGFINIVRHSTGKSSLFEVVFPHELWTIKSTISQYYSDYHSESTMKKYLTVIKLYEDYLTQL
jgi:hypothetical protein